MIPIWFIVHRWIQIPIRPQCHLDAGLVPSKLSLPLVGRRRVGFVRFRRRKLVRRNACQNILSLKSSKHLKGEFNNPLQFLGMMMMLTPLEDTVRPTTCYILFVSQRTGLIPQPINQINNVSCNI